jgi:hypothetical protein
MTIGRIPSIEGGIQPTIFDAKADILTATAADTPARLGVGANDTVLTADSSTSTGLKWAAPAGAGKVLQVVSATTTTSTTIATTTLTDTTVTATITPTSATSKILVLISAQMYHTRSTAQAFAGGVVLRGATTILNYGVEHLNAVRATGSTSITVVSNQAYTYLDSPNTTSATTYKLQAKVEETADNHSITCQNGGSPSTITLLEIGA